MKFSKCILLFVLSFVSITGSRVAHSSPPANSVPPSEAALCRAQKLSLNKLETEFKRAEYQITTSDRRVVTADKRSIRQAALIEKSNSRIKILQDLINGGAAACEANRKAANCNKIRVAQRALPKLSSNLTIAQEKLKRYQAATEALKQAGNLLKSSLAQLKANILIAKEATARCYNVGSSSSSSSSTGSTQVAFDYAVNLNAQVDKKFPINQGFSLSLNPGTALTLDVLATPFYYLNGTNSASTDSFQFSLEAARSQVANVPSSIVGLWPSNVNATLSLPPGYCANAAEFQFANFGGELNLGVNSAAIKTSRTYAELFDTSSGNIAISGSAGRSGSLSEAGLVRLGGRPSDCISKVVFGGQELWVHSILFKQIRRVTL